MNRKIEEFDGLIISEVNYSESSKILNVLTDKYGVIGVISKGCRNIKSKLRGVSRKLVYGRFNVYYKSDGLSTLISCDVINSYNNIVSNLTSISYTSYIIDLVNQVSKENNDSSMFPIIIAGLNKINDNFNPLVITNMIEVKLLNYLGVRPSIDSCSYCGGVNSIVSLSSSSGGYVCSNCYSDQEIVSHDAIKMIRLYYYVDINNISKLNISENVSYEINRFLSDYYDRYTGIYMKSKDFLKQIEHINL